MAGPHDIAEIERTSALYGHLLDWGEFDRLGDVFAPDGAYEGPRGGRVRGVAALRDYFASNPNKDRVEIHAATNLVVDLIGEGEAMSVSKWLCVMDGKLVHGQYTDRWIKTPTGWRIALRKSDATEMPEHLRRGRTPAAV